MSHCPNTNSVAPLDCLHDIMNAALAAVDPAQLVPEYLPDPPTGRTIVIGAGKASARMAKAVEDHWKHDLTGLVVTRYGHQEVCERIEVVEAAHPVPDQAGLDVARRMLALVSGLTADDLVICLVSGGGSALLSLPLDGITKEEKRQINRDLLKSGATIAEMNCVRRHLSAVKGGRLAAACFPARVYTLVISDVPGDDPSVVASGPTCPDWSTPRDAVAILTRYGIAVSARALAVLGDPAAAGPTPDDPRLSRNEVVVIATAADALRAAETAARNLGIRSINLGGAIEGEAAVVARDQASMVRELLQRGGVKAERLLILSGGETTVTVKGTGRGGRNAEFLLALAVALNGMPDVYALAIDTDGIDGTETNAGAVVMPDTLSRARALRLDSRAMLMNNDGYTFFEKIGDLVVTGPTKTNVNDFRAILIDCAARKFDG